MPEVPEVQAHAERLDASFGGTELTRFLPLAFTALKTVQPDPAVIHGEELTSVGRRGKALLLQFPSATHVVHLMQGGRLEPDEKQAREPRNGQARWTFADGRALLLTEAGTERKAGVWVVDGDPDVHEPLSRLGPEAADVGTGQLADLLAAENTRVHSFLRDQRRIAGLGRRLANEICHRAQLSPFAMTAKLGDDEVERLVVAIGACVGEGLAYERGRDDMSSSKERPGAVHHRTGEACPVCGDEVREVAYNAYTVHYCATCQTDGKVLADNTTSKFLK
ncbi:MAG: DNA-formamidopyrimidine glycosylase family protein [Acidimicrobiales bacterium]|nr:DNA-formamidopyrimidine glycosylase family protein [Acidimicrobiales bacterium]